MRGNSPQRKPPKGSPGQGKMRRQPGKPLAGAPKPGGGGAGKGGRVEMVSKKPSRRPPTPFKPLPIEKRKPKRTATSRPRPGVGPKPITRPVKRGR
jgi:hypothetical protein